MRRWLYPTLILIAFAVVSAAGIWHASRFEESAGAIIPSAALGTSLGFPLTNPETETYAVYSAVIRDMYLEDGVRLLVIQRGDDCRPSSDKASDLKVEDRWGGMDEYASKELPGLTSETIEDFQAKTKQCFQIRERFDVPIKYILAGKKDLDFLFSARGLDRSWTRFYARYPGSSGIINFSNVGFDVEMKQALVSTGRGCGGLCGAGYYVLLTKENAVWSVKSKRMTWVS